jgi:hypothetical protein
MAPPVWVTGQVLSASDINNWFVPLVATKTADQSVTSSTTLVNDSELSLTPGTSATYFFNVYINFEGANGAGFLKFGWGVPTGALLRYQAVFQGTGGSAVVQNTNTATDTPAANTQGAGVLCGLSMHGTLIMGSTSGVVQFKWAQNASSATATTVHAQSVFALQRVT